jgi:hypothetical protein
MRRWPRAGRHGLACRPVERAGTAARTHAPARAMTMPSSCTPCCRRAWATSSAIPARWASAPCSAAESALATRPRPGARRGGHPQQRYGEAIAAHILDWSQGDGALPIVNMGFPLRICLGRPGQLGAHQPRAAAAGAASAGWGETAPSPWPMAQACPLPPPPAYSEEPGFGFPPRGAGGLRGHRSLTRRAARHRPLLVRRPDAVADAARTLDRHRAADLRARGARRARLPRRDAGPPRHRAGRFLHRLLARQIRIRSAAPRHLYQPPYRSRLAAAAHHAALSRISERPQHAVGRRGDRADGGLRRGFRVHRRHP